VLLSNAPRRVAQVQMVLQAMGIDDVLYTDVLTSGEATHVRLRDRPDDWFRALGRQVLHIGEPRDRSVIAGLPLDLVEQPEDASFVLNTGLSDALATTDGAAYAPLLQACADRRLPTLGGEVRSLGKPDPAIYAPVIERLGLPRARILAVGDGLRTDIAGARAAGIDSCWVLGGIHSGEPDPQATARAAGLTPVAAIPSFAW
jgi:ribonucleotide monophosphatase NagD (HAD superfamily)